MGADGKWHVGDTKAKTSDSGGYLQSVDTDAIDPTFCETWEPVSNVTKPYTSGFNGPRLIAITPDGSFALVANENDNSISRIDLNTGETTKPYTSGFSSPYGIAIAPDGSFALVTNNGDDSVSRITISVGAFRVVPADPSQARTTPPLPPSLPSLPLQILRAAHPVHLLAGLGQTQKVPGIATQAARPSKGACCRGTRPWPCPFSCTSSWRCSALHPAHTSHL